MGYLTILNSFFFIFFSFFVYFYFQKLKEKIETLRHEKESLNHSVEMTSQILMGMGQRIISLESQVKKTLKIQEELEQSQRKQGLEQAYHHAKKLFELGVSVSDVASHCHIPYAEADLIGKLSARTSSHQI